ncbi:hypothetical protein SeMB42_g02038 [Synchytrium endobioticum]|uniref:SET domain-containing protein n=1 Tax=Synchytrium endobioticum TaxID=286115 RepID=A0A507DIG9_9FUNG|nr:hypothetical protein SeLEV6574_g05799 [Synchytrium endobioticum]TPX51027.1 hypothetical protein SeMB42_g02038 [Synchytrium endobioticum]
MSAITIRHDALLGNFAVASRDLQQGDLVLETTPYGISINHDCRKRGCHTCYTISPYPATYSISCLSCKAVYYCSPHCCDLKQPHHLQHECTAFIDISNLGPSYRKHVESARQIMKERKRGISHDLAYVYSAGDVQDLARFILGISSRRFIENGNIAHPTYEDVGTLITNRDSLPPLEHLQLEYLHAFLSTFPATSDSTGPHFADLFTSHYTLHHFINLICIRTCNGFGLWCPESESIGSSIYPAASYFNNSCQPNLMRVTGLLSHSRICASRHGTSIVTFVANEPVLRFYALHAIRRDEPLFHSYIDLTLPAKERRSQLKEGYYFDYSARPPGYRDGNADDAKAIHTACSSSDTPLVDKCHPASPRLQQHLNKRPK